MRNLLFTISFDGSDYHGWQSQINAVTIQDTVKAAFGKLTGEQPVITGCSRTDAGVHANMFCFSVKTQSSIPDDRFVPALNSKLPDDIAVSNCIRVPEDFNARFSCVKKEYEYLIYNGKIRNPFYDKRAMHYPILLDDKRMNEAARYFMGTHDFTAFCSADTEVLSKVRTVYDCNVSRKGDLVSFRICADGFLYNMVRIIVGTLLYTESGKIKPKDIPSVIDGLDRTKAGITAPADGLYLNKVFYDFDIQEV